MRKFFFLLVITGFSVSLAAQAPGAKPGAPSRMPQNFNGGQVYGKIVDRDGKAVSDASVLLLTQKMDTVTKKSKEVLLKGMTSAKNGEFNFEDLPVAGKLSLKISATGFKAYEQAVSFMPSKPSPGTAPAFEQNLGKIKLETEVTNLQEVTVTANKSALKLDIDKKVFNVEKNLLSAGGTALDIMKNVPSLNVDIDGNLTLRNSTPQLFVDGRPTTLTLEQIPADAIESVEVITNPSAKYDASGGGAGILNIVLKKNKKTGYNGSIRAGIDKRGATNAGIDFNARQNKINVFGSVNINQMKGRTSGTTDRLNLTDTPQTAINQVNYNKTNGAFLFGRAGLDYFVTNRTTLSLAAFKVHGEFNPYESIGINTDSLYNTGTLNSFSERISTGSRVFNGQGLAFGMKTLFPKEGEELTFDANFFSGKNKSNAQYTTNLFAYGAGSAITGTDWQKVLGDGNDKNLVLQTDYVKPITATTKFETGLRAALRQRVTNNYNYMFDKTSGEYLLIPSAASNYENSDQVYAAYASITSSIKNFGYKVGLRAERSDYTGNLVESGLKFSNNYPVSLFPSIFLSEKLKNNQELQVSITRRINRPNFFQLIPFVDYTDKLNITKGNPDLVPEFTNSMEFSYSKTFQHNNSFLASVYYKKTNNLITRSIEKDINPFTGEEDLINTYINANSGQSFGTELTTQLFPTNWWDLTTNVNIYNSVISTSETTAADNGMWSWFGKFNSNFKLPSNFNIQLSATYQSKTNLIAGSGGGQGGPGGARGGNGGGPGGGGGFGQAQSASQGYINSNYGVDLAVKKSFLKNNVASATLSISDIFKTRRFDQHSSSEYFIQDYNRLRDPQMVRLTLAYRFGKIDAKLFKRKSQGTNESVGEGM